MLKKCFLVLVFLYIPMAAVGYYQLGLLADNDGGTNILKSQKEKKYIIYFLASSVSSVTAPSSLLWRY